MDNKEPVVEEDQDQQQQALDPVEQESITFHGEQVVAVRLADGRICVVLRWICNSLQLQAGGQVRRIERTASIANELVRVKVQTRGGKQVMPALSLRGFPTWILGINPNEVKDGENPREAERIRQMILAFQVEAADVLYQHFAQKARPALTAPHTPPVPVELAQPQVPQADATHAELATYHEQMALWHRYQADRHAQQWRGEVDTWRGTVEARLESEEAMLGLIPDILERLGPETLSPAHQRQVQVLAKQLHLATKKPYATIYDDFKTAFEKPRIEDLLEDDWLQIKQWFEVQISRTKQRQESSNKP